MQAIKNNGSLRYLNQTLKIGHAYGSKTDIMKVMKTEKKEKHLNTL
jgi:hypothetical protein